MRALRSAAHAAWLLAAAWQGPLAAGDLGGIHKADRVIIEKSARVLRLFAGGREIGRYNVGLGRNPVGTKECQGDNRTPEGVYTVSSRLSESAFHRSLRLSYPSLADLERARRRGCSPGGDIMIHGTYAGPAPPRGRRRTGDWTRGCVAVSNEEIEQIWSLVPDGTPVEIRP